MLAGNCHAEALRDDGELVELGRVAREALQGREEVRHRGVGDGPGCEEEGPELQELRQGRPADCPCSTHAHTHRAATTIIIRGLHDSDEQRQNLSASKLMFPLRLWMIGSSASLSAFDSTGTVTRTHTLHTEHRHLLLLLSLSSSAAVVQISRDALGRVSRVLSLTDPGAGSMGREGGHDCEEKPDHAVLQEEDPEHHAPVAGLHLAPLHEALDHDCRGGHRDKHTDEEALPPARSQKNRHRKAPGACFCPAVMRRQSG